MKTAMQEAIEIIEERLKIISIVQRTKSTMGAIAGYQYSKYLLMELLEKEKEQIIEARENGLMDGIGDYVLTEWGKDSELLTSEQYYNQKYQNK